MVDVKRSLEQIENIGYDITGTMHNSKTSAAENTTS